MYEDTIERDEGRTVALHGEEDFAAMRRAGRLAAEVLDFITPHVQPGATTEALDRLCTTSSSTMAPSRPR